jgi:hypothetical protein
MRTGVARLCMSGFILVCSLNPGYSGLVVEGTRDSLSVHVDQVLLSDVIEALGRKFSVRVKTAVSPNISVDGHFAGSLNFVIARLLRGYDFVLVMRQDNGTEEMDIILLGQSAAAGSSPALLRASPDPQLIPTRNDGFK